MLLKQDGKTCLNTALWRGHANVANMLIYKGANVNLADQVGNVSEIIENPNSVLKLLNCCCYGKQIFNVNSM